MTTTTLPLTNQAQAMLKELQRQSGVLSAQVDQVVQAEAQKLQQAAPTQQAGTVPALDCDVLEKILVQAMPQQAQVIQDAKACGLKHHPDKTNGRFLTQILSMRIEKDTNVAINPPPSRPHVPVRVDPLYATFTMAPNANVMLLFNARNVDEKGQPLLMKIVARESVDTSKLDLSKYRTDPNGTKPDIVVIKDGASYVETKDIDETEFAFGDPLKQVSLQLDPKTGTGDEISTSVWVRPENIHRTNAFQARRVGNSVVPDTSRPLPARNRVDQGDHLDTQPVATFDQRIRMTLQAKSTLPPGTWLDDKDAGAHVDMSLAVDRGLIFEPGSSAAVAVAGPVTAQLDLAVDKGDAHLLGNDSKETPATVAPTASLREILTANLTRTSRASLNGSDANTQTRRIVDVVYGDAAARKIGDRNFTPLGDSVVAQADMVNMKLSCTAQPMQNPADPQSDGARVALTLEDAFLSGADFTGYTVVAGFRDESGAWQEQTKKVGSESSKKERFVFDVTDFDDQQKKNANLEIRLFNKDGVPAQRVLVPFREIHWGN